MEEESEGLSSFSYVTILNTPIFPPVWIHFCANQSNITYSETVFCRSPTLDSVYFEVSLY